MNKPTKASLGLIYANIKQNNSPFLGKREGKTKK
jgi:hypothetical protein